MPDLNSPPAATAQWPAQAELFCIRSIEIFEHVLSGKMLMCDAVDLLYDASVASGLELAIGPDAVQKLLVASFASASASHDRRPS
jgi:hypothetical protein